MGSPTRVPIVLAWAAWTVCGLTPAPAAARTPATPARTPATAARQASQNPAPADLDQVIASALTLFQQGRHQEARAALDAAAGRLATAPAGQRAQALWVRAQVERALSRHDDAERAAADGVTEAVRAGNTRIEAELRLVQITLAGDRGDAALMNERIALAEDAARRADAQGVLAAVLAAKGRALRAQGKPRESLEAHSAALAIAEAMDYPQAEIQYLGLRATTYLGLGDYDEALADAQRAYDLARRPDIGGALLSSATFALAQVLGNIRDLERAADLWTEAVEAYRKTGPEIGVALSIRQRMDVYYALEDYDRAASDGATALEMFERTGSAGTTIGLLSRLSLIQARRGQRAEADAAARRAEADAYARRAEAMLEGTPDRQRITVDLDLGLMALAQAEPDQAAARFRRVAETADRLSDPDYRWRAEQGLGQAAMLAGRVDEAAAHFDRAVATIEALRRALPEAGLRATFLADRMGPYDGQVAALMARASGPDDPLAGAALAASERARGRALADLLAEPRWRSTDPAFVRLRDEEAAFGRRFTALQREITGASDASARTEAERRLADAERDYDAFVIRARRETPALASLAYPEPLDAAAIASAAGPGEAIVAFWIAADHGFVWSVRDGRVRGYPIEGAGTLEPSVRFLLAGIAASDRAAVEASTADLGRRLLGPVAGDLAGVRSIVIVPDGPLVRVPFAVLRPDGADAAPLVRRAASTLAPSITLLGHLRAGARAPLADRHSVVVASSQPPALDGGLRQIYRDEALRLVPLVEAEQEARDVARRTGAPPGALLVGAGATETAFKHLLAGGARVVHVATHAVLDEAVPRRSAILLGAGGDDDGLLQLNEIAALPIDADLVMLSACRTHLGRLVRGEGFVSLSRTFMLAGARAVGASLWAVDDRATRVLMDRFYDALGDGQAPDEALRTAQVAMIDAGGAEADPITWAGFVITGAATRPLFDHPPGGGPTSRIVAAAVAILLLVVIWWGAARQRQRRVAP
ncbi:MAG: CHAT domain-containing tetratricopeptide repeat protein [Vicinamibacterales bacterium]